MKSPGADWEARRAARSAHGAGRLTRWCRVADRLGLTSDPPDRRTPVQRGGSVLRWLAGRHVDHCPRCQAELAEWRRIVAWMQTSRSVKAPPGALAPVMARIAAERMAQGRTLGPVMEWAPASRAARRPRGGGAGSEIWIWGSFAGASALGALAPKLPGLIEWVSGLMRAALALWGDGLAEGIVALQRIGEPLPAGIQPYFQALWWCVAGCSAAMTLVMIASEHSERLRE